MGFSKNFMWGAATASYQVEGAAFEDGKGLNVWDICCMQPGFVRDADTGNEACDHYHRYKEDVAIMKKMGLKAYRFSISWARVLPEGTGKINEAGLKFYDNLVDELIENGIEPYVTLFHWDYPDALFKRGGWLNPESSDWFAEYAKVIVERLSDRVKNWMTINEPQCFIGIGHESGVHAPGMRYSKRYIVHAIHNTLLAHGKAVRVIREYTKQPCMIGYAPVADVTIPFSDSEKDIEAARKCTFEDKTSDNSIWINTLWMDPIYLGKYPEGFYKANKQWFDEVMKPGDMDIISSPIDFFGMNSYQGRTVKADDNGYEFVKNSVGYDHTAIRWPMTPKILYYGPRFFYERYKKPILVTENGMSNYDIICSDGKVHDQYRIEFLNKYLHCYKQAADEGIPLIGYMQWSLMDNFEWSEGYNERFGLVYVDYTTKERTLKDSAYWYSDIIAKNGENL